MSIDEAVQEKDYFKYFHSISLPDRDPSIIREHPGIQGLDSENMWVKFPLDQLSHSGEEKKNHSCQTM